MNAPASSNPQPSRATVHVHHAREEIDAVEDTIAGLAEAMGYGKAQRFALRLAIEEALVNAFLHGHENLSPDLPVRVDYEVQPDRVVVAVEDQGPGFVPAEVADPTLDENLEIPSGRGIVLIRAYMSDVRYNAKGNRIEMELRRAAESQ